MPNQQNRIDDHLPIYFYNLEGIAMANAMTGGTHIRWAFRLANWQPDKAQIRRSFARIQRDEIDRLMKFVFLDDLKASLVGRLLIRNFVSIATGEANSRISLGRDARGKPFYCSPTGKHKLDFNVSHQGGYAVLAGWWTTDREATAVTRLGVDVMKMEYTGGKPIHEFFRLMDRNFTSEEWRYIKSTNISGEAIRRFMRVWCLKESYVKTLGVGITVDLRQINFIVKSELSVTPNEVTVSTGVALNGRTTAEDNWHFEETLLDEDHCVAVAIEGPRGDEFKACSDGFRSIDIEWLLDNIDQLTNEADIGEELCAQVLQKEVK